MLSSFARANASHVCVFSSGSYAFVDPGCRGFGDVEIYRPALTLKQFHYLYRPLRREVLSDPLDEFNSLKDRMPWLEERAKPYHA